MAAKINRSCGLRATWTWLRWGTGGLSCQRGIGEKIIWQRKINHSCGLRATWTWLRWGTGGLSCRRGIGETHGTRS